VPEKDETEEDNDQAGARGAEEILAIGDQ